MSTPPPTTIYVVTSGEYSYYGINRLFSTPEKATAYIKDNKITRGEVEEWDLDELVAYTLKTVWSCHLRVKDGEIIDEFHHNESCGPRFTRTSNSNSEIWAHSLVSQDHARKLAMEKRQDILRGKGSE